MKNQFHFAGTHCGAGGSQAAAAAAASEFFASFTSVATATAAPASAFTERGAERQKAGGWLNS